MNYGSIALPIAFRFFRIPIKWTVDRIGNKRVVTNTVFRAEVLDEKLTELDPVSARLRFLRLKNFDTTKELVRPALEFLNSVGSFMEHDQITENVEICIPDRESTEALSYPKLEIGIWEIEDCLEILGDQMRTDRPIYPSLQLGLRYNKARPEPFMSMASFWQAALAITLVDRIKKAKVRSCAECGAPFSIHTKHAKKFCTWSCAHRAAVRQSRIRKDAGK